MSELILIHISGEDQRGLTAKLTRAMARFDADIMDMGQAVIHDMLSLGILVRLPTEQSAEMIRDLLFLAHDLGVKCKCMPIGAERYEGWAEGEQRDRHIVTILGRTITARQVAAVSAVVADNGLNIEVVTRLSGRMPLAAGQAHRPACIELFVNGEPNDIERMRREFLDISAKHGVDIALQKDNVFRRNRRLVVFDMDSTLIQAEVIDELARVAGVGEAVSEITARAMRGELDFKESLAKRLQLLEGLDEAKLDEVAEAVLLTEGAERLIVNLKRFGYKIAVISGGFTYFGRKLQERLGIDYLYANELEIENGRITGRVLGEIVDAERKAELLTSIAAQENISLQQVIAVGDGANDLPMLSLAGLGIAFHAKPVVREGARQAISTLGLDSILYLIGLRERDTLT